MSWRQGIHGYAARWDAITAPLSRPNAPHLSRPARFQRDCFAYDPATVEIWFMHRGAQVIGRGAELGLEIWADDYGLAFAFTPPAGAYSLADGVADGRYAQCSVGAGIAESSPVPHHNGYLDIITLAGLREISICPVGACPGAVCWHAAAPSAHLPALTAALVPTWMRSREANRQIRRGYP